MESFFSSLKTERTARKVYKTRDDAKADVFDYSERFYNPKRRHSTLGYLSPNEFEKKGRISLTQRLKNRQKASSEFSSRSERTRSFLNDPAHSRRKPYVPD